MTFLTTHVDIIKNIGLVLSIGLMFAFVFFILFPIVWRVIQIAFYGLIAGIIFFYPFTLGLMIFNPSYRQEFIVGIAAGDKEAWGMLAFWVVPPLLILLVSLWLNRGNLFKRTGTPKYRLLHLKLKLKEVFSNLRFRHTKQPKVAEEPVSFQSQNTYLIRDLELLGCEVDSTESEIKKAYRQLSKKYHPDMNSDPHAAIIFKQIQKAYANLVS